MKKRILITLGGLGLLIIAFIAYKVIQVTKLSPDIEERIKKLASAKGVAYPIPAPNIVIKKSDRRLRLYSGETLLKEYAIALGSNPSDDKQREGDGCTPEGEFYICTKNIRSGFHLFLGISYPSIEDAERGFRDGLITQSEKDAIVTANKVKEKPPWDTRLGGAIGIHGTGIRGTLATYFKTDWTAGCIALNNYDMEELFPITNLGDKVIIQR